MLSAAMLAKAFLAKQQSTKRPQHRMHRRNEKLTSKRRVLNRMARQSRKRNRQ